MSDFIHPDAVQAVIQGDHGDPFSILGAHAVGDNAVSIRAMRPTARQLFVVLDGAKHEMTRLRDEGFFALTLERFQGRYAFEAQTFDDEANNRVENFYDPYAFPPLLSDYDLHLLSEGTHLASYEKMGAHPTEIDGIPGVNFAVWAPNAFRVSVVGTFNRWDERVHPMRRHIANGIWELFIPEAKPGDIYRYDIRSQFNGYKAAKSDPYGFFSEVRPQNASVVVDLGGYAWGDEAWLTQRANQDPLSAPVSIYEVHLGSWRRSAAGHWLTYRELAEQLVPYVRDLGYTHIELLPLAEHPLDASWGYQVTGYFAVTSRYGTPQDFMYFVDQCHQNGIGVIMDWVPAHFPKDGHALSYFDGTYLYEHADPRQSEHPDWGTYIFNYGRIEVRNFLVANALFWLKVYHIDGLRVDAVSSMLYLDFSRKEGQWIPNRYGSNENLEAIDFLRYLNTIVHGEVPGTCMIAEESTAWPMVSRPLYLGGLGFTLKWDMGWMHDTLAYMQTDPVYRRYVHNRITFSLAYFFSENFVLSLSHDEVVHGKGSLINKMPGDWWQKFASLRLLFGYQFTHPGKKLNFMGQEFGQWREWSETRDLDWYLLDWPTHHRLQHWVRDLNHLYRQEPALYRYDFDQAGFRWIEPNDAEQSVFSYTRMADDDLLVIICNFTPVPRYHYRVGVPKAGRYREVLNSDAEHYGGGNVGNAGMLQTDSMAWHAHTQSMDVTVPPLGMVILKYEAE